MKTAQTIYICIGLEDVSTKHAKKYLQVYSNWCTSPEGALNLMEREHPFAQRVHLYKFEKSANLKPEDTSIKYEKKYLPKDATNDDVTSLLNILNV